MNEKKIAFKQKSYGKTLCYNNCDFNKKNANG